MTSARAARRLGALALCVLAACSGNGGGAKKGSSTTQPDLASSSTALPSSAPPTTSTPDTVASGSCGGELAFGETAGEWASTKAAAPTEFTVTRFSRSATNAAWAHALLVPDDRAHDDALWVVARCDGAQWVVVDGGTSGVGCTGGVPADLGVECR